MIRSPVLITCAVLFFASPLHLLAEFVSAVEVTDLRGNSDYRICTDTEKKKLEEEIKAEEKVFLKAMQEAMIEWKTAGNKSFPSSRLRKRSMKVLKTTGKQDEAQAILVKTEEQKKQAATTKMREQQDVLNRKAPVSKHNNRKGGRGNNNAAAAQLKREQEDIRDDLEQDANANKAEVILRKHLAAISGHEVPFFGETPQQDQPVKKAHNKKKH